MGPKKARKKIERQNKASTVANQHSEFESPYTEPQQLTDTDVERDSSISRSEASDEGASSANVNITKKKRRKPKAKIARVLTKEEEDEVIDWLKRNRFLYDKSCSEFKNRAKKERAWSEMEEKINLNPGDLYRWYTSLRTTYVKEVKKRENATRSGAEAYEGIVTPRITWLLDKFQFLKPYVCQSRGTKGSKLLKRDSHSPRREPSILHNRASESRSPTCPSKKATLTDYLDRVSQQLTVPKSEIENTCDFLSTLMEKMTPTRLEEFTHETILKAMDYVKQSNLERGQPQQTSHGSIQLTQPSFTLASASPMLQPQTQLQSTQNTDYIIAHNIAASNPPADIIQQHGQYQWAQFQPSNLQPILTAQLHPATYSTQLVSVSQASSATTVTSTPVMTNASEALNKEKDN